MSEATTELTPKIKKELQAYLPKDAFADEPTHARFFIFGAGVRPFVTLGDATGPHGTAYVCHTQKRLFKFDPRWLMREDDVIVVDYARFKKAVDSKLPATNNGPTGGSTLENTRA